MPRDRLPLLHLGIARLVSQLSTCQRASVGVVLTDPYGEQVLGYGYNGNAAGLPNVCDRTGADAVGNCGCIHAELNALLKAGRGPKIAFSTTTPCVACAKAYINGGVRAVRADSWYRERSGVVMLESVGIHVYVGDDAAKYVLERPGGGLNV